MSGLSRFERLSRAAGPELLAQVTGAKFWYSYDRKYKQRKNKLSIDAILAIARDENITVRNRKTKEVLPATPEQADKIRRARLFDHLFVPNHLGGKTTCHILINPENNVIITGEAVCHPKLDAFNAKHGRRAARERAICAALESLGVKDTLPPQLRVPKSVQRKNRIRNVTSAYLQGADGLLDVVSK
jgi:hypothetical protein